jgi:hypothetical protein
MSGGYLMARQRYSDVRQLGAFPSAKDYPIGRNTELLLFIVDVVVMI